MLNDPQYISIMLTSSFRMFHYIFFSLLILFNPTWNIITSWWSAKFSYPTMITHAVINKNPIQWSLPVSALSPPSFLLEDLTLSNSHLQVHVMINQSHASMNHAKQKLRRLDIVNKLPIWSHWKFMITLVYINWYKLKKMLKIF